MKLSAPIYRLKRQAKLLSREAGIPLNQALDRLAAEEGFKSWSLLAAKLAAESPASKIYSQLRPGDMVLIGARPGQGKTLLSLEVAIEAMRGGHRAWFFSLEYTEKDCLSRFESIGVDFGDYQDRFVFDGSDLICADYIVSRLKDAKSGTVAVIDYLQLLDQRRESPPLGEQVKVLKEFAALGGVTLLVISQIDRSFDLEEKGIPSMQDIRMPNQIDLSVFNKSYFLSNGVIKKGNPEI